MQEPPLVSIITVVLNAREELQQTIESIRSQTYRNIEYIIIDGGSHDGTIDVIRENGHCISQWISEPDRGISDAFNKGIALAKGTIIGILNAGDRYRPHALDAVAQEYLRSEEKERFFCSGHMVVEAWDIELKADPLYALKLPFMMPLINHPTCFVARSIYDELGRFNTSLSIAMDYEFFLRCHKAGVTFTSVDTVIVDIDDFGVSNARFWKGYREVLRYSENKFLTLLMAPYILFNRIRVGMKTANRSREKN